MGGSGETPPDSMFFLKPSLRSIGNIETDIMCWVQDDCQIEKDTKYCFGFLLQTCTRFPNRYLFSKQILVCKTDTCFLLRICLGLVQKEAEPRSALDPGSWLQIFDQEIFGSLASNIYIVYYAVVLFCCLYDKTT